jgi:hypothetical protein
MDNADALTTCPQPFVTEGQPIPVRQLQTAPLLLESSKLAVIAVLTREMVEGSNAQRLKDCRSRSAALIDAALFSTAAATTAAPAGLCHGIAALTGSASTDPAAAMMGDVAKVLGAVSTVAGNRLPVPVAAPARVTMLRLLTPSGLQSIAVLASSAIAAGDFLAIASNAIVSATDSVPENRSRAKPSFRRWTPAQRRSLRSSMAPRMSA